MSLYFWESLFRARRSEVPDRGLFFDCNIAHEFVIISIMMIVGSRTVNGALDAATHQKKPDTKKKPDSNEPGLRYWPR
jgi:hypothetical protein